MPASLLLDSLSSLLSQKWPSINAGRGMREWRVFLRSRGTIGDKEPLASGRKAAQSDFEQVPYAAEHLSVEFLFKGIGEFW